MHMEAVFCNKRVGRGHGCSAGHGDQFTLLKPMKAPELNICGPSVLSKLTSLLPNLQGQPLHPA